MSITGRREVPGWAHADGMAAAQAVVKECVRAAAGKDPGTAVVALASAVEGAGDGRKHLLWACLTSPEVWASVLEGLRCLRAAAVVAGANLVTAVMGAADPVWADTKLTRIQGLACAKQLVSIVKVAPDGPCGAPAAAALYALLTVPVLWDAWPRATVSSAVEGVVAVWSLGREPLSAAALPGLPQWTRRALAHCVDSPVEFAAQWRRVVARVAPRDAPDVKQTLEALAAVDGPEDPAVVAARAARAARAAQAFAAAEARAADARAGLKW
jgi:hypothetical protein